MKEINLKKYNRHWEKGFRYPFILKRSCFNDLLAALPRHQIEELAGLRRTGKTVLLFQVINHLLDSGADPFSILYFTFDEDRFKIDDLLSEFVRQSGVDYKSSKVYLFLDEIQKLPDFANQLKVYYDLYPNIKFFISGSTSLFVRKKTQESLAGRINSFYLTPLDFAEYLTFRNKSELTAKPRLYEQELNLEFDRFLSSQFVESVFIDNESEKRNYIVSIARKIIFEDIPQVFSVSNPEILWRIVKVVAAQPGVLVDYRSLCSDIGISNKTISLYFHYLEESFILKKIYNFSRSMLTTERKLKKFYMASPSFSIALSDFVDRGRIAENLFISLRNCKFFWRDSSQHEVDFIELDGDRIVPVEIKYKNAISAGDFDNISIFAKKFKCDNGIIVTKTIEPTKYSLKSGFWLEERSIFAPLTV